MDDRIIDVYEQDFEPSPKARSLMDGLRELAGPPHPFWGEVARKVLVATGNKEEAHPGEREALIAAIAEVRRKKEKSRET